MLKGENLHLRIVEPGDENLLYRWENDPNNWRVSNTIAPFSLHILKEFVRSTQDIYINKQLRFMICLNSGREVGTLDLFDFDPINARSGLGVLIGEKEDRGKGYAKEALSLMLDYGKNNLKLNTYFCTILKSNEASIRLFEQLDFVNVGCKKMWQRVSENEWEDELIYQYLFN